MLIGFLPSAALRNLQYSMVWKVGISVLIKPSFEQISKNATTRNSLQISSAGYYVDIHFYYIPELIPKYHLKRLFGYCKQMLRGKKTVILQSVNLCLF